MTNLSPKTDTKTGANCTGTDGNTGRTYTLMNANAVTQMFTISKSGSGLAQGTDFTMANDVVTFSVAVFDTEPLVFNYFVSDSVTIANLGYTYCTINDVYRTSGITSSEVSNADVTQHILEAESVVCKVTNQVYWKTAVDTLTVVSSANKAVTVSGTTLNVNEFAGMYVWLYMTSGNTVLQARKIVSNTADTLTVDRAWNDNPAAGDLCRIFYAPSEIEIYQDAQLDGNDQTYFYLPLYPVQILEGLSINGTTVTPSNVYVYNKRGMIKCKSGSEASRFTSAVPQDIDVQYWRGLEYLPYNVKRLVELRAAINILSQQMGGTFDDPSMVSMPEMSVTVGQAYINIAGTLERLRAEYDDLVNKGKVFPVFG